MSDKSDHKQDEGQKRGFARAVWDISNIVIGGIVALVIVILSFSSGYWFFAALAYLPLRYVWGGITGDYPDEDLFINQRPDFSEQNAEHPNYGTDPMFSMSPSSCMYTEPDIPSPPDDPNSN